MRAAFAGGFSGPAIQGADAVFFGDYYQTVDGHKVFIPSANASLNVGILPRMSVLFTEDRGTSPVESGFQASVADFEGKLGYSLTGSNSAQNFAQNLTTWVSWRIWTSKEFFNGLDEFDRYNYPHDEYDREEGMGMGVAQAAPLSGPVSCYYNFGLYPAVRVKIKDSASRVAMELGPAFKIGQSLQFYDGYRYQSILTDGFPHQRADERGFVMGLRSSF